jgi:16S rRNA processing protein RimM
MLHLIHIGRLGRSFAKNGKNKIVVKEQFESVIEELDHIFLWQNGQYIPYFVEEIEDHNDLLIKLEGVDDIESANALVNLEVFASDRQLDFDEFKSVLPFNENELIGFEIFDHNSNIKLLIKDVVEYPGQMMIMAMMEDDIQCMIPLVEEWIVSINEKGKIIEMTLPNGLILNEEEE